MQRAASVHWAICAMLLASATASHAQSGAGSRVGARVDGTVIRPSDRVIGPQLKRLLLELAVAKKKLDTDPVPCAKNPDADACDPVVVKVLTVTDTLNNTFCALRLPSQIKVALPRKKRAVTWRLDTSEAPAGTTVAFDEEHGILAVTEKSELKEGKWGTGSDGKQDKMLWTASNQHSKGADVVYVPIVLMRDANRKVSICASPDPIIVNE